MSTTSVTTAQGLRETRRLHLMELSKAQIMDVAERLFAEQGYHATSIEDIAVASEFSVGGIYKIFGGKEEIFKAVIVRRGPEVTQILQACCGSDDPADQKLRNLAVGVLTYMRQYPYYGMLSSKILALVPSGFPEVPEVEAAIGTARELYTAVVKQGQLDGLFCAGEPEYLATIVLTLLNAHMQADALRSDQVGGGAELDDFVALLLRALGVSGRPGEHVTF
jgi:AcrR family transcriptional regulator